MEGTDTESVPSDDHPRYVFAVVTNVPEPGDIGNAAIPPFDIYVDAQAFGGSFTDQPKPLLKAIGADPMLGLFLRTPVFYLGEILILTGEYEREVVGLGRKPSKWERSGRVLRRRVRRDHPVG